MGSGARRSVLTEFCRQGRDWTRHGLVEAKLVGSVIDKVAHGYDPGNPADSRRCHVEVMLRACHRCVGIIDAEPHGMRWARFATAQLGRRARRHLGG
jgi:hypothetical protein